MQYEMGKIYRIVSREIMKKISLFFPAFETLTVFPDLFTKHFCFYSFAEMVMKTFLLISD
jgi:hypothetical protein